MAISLIIFAIATSIGALAAITIAMQNNDNGIAFTTWSFTTVVSLFALLSYTLQKKQN